MTWNTKTLIAEDEVFDCLIRLRGNKWHCRGQSQDYGGLLPSIDRDKMMGMSRLEKITRERRGIDIFRASARFFSHPGEIGSLTDDFVALAILRHHFVRTRLLDWSRSPFVAAFFAVHNNDDNDGEIWSLDEAEYIKKAQPQWDDPANWLYELNKAAFNVNDVADFFVFMSYPKGFGRQNAQDGLYSVTSKLDCDHADCIERLLDNPSACTRYIIPKYLKPMIRDHLRERHGIWNGALYPDTAGAAKTAGEVFPE
jgi:hypothetical protein